MTQINDSMKEGIANIGWTIEPFGHTAVMLRFTAPSTNELYSFVAENPEIENICRKAETFNPTDYALAWEEARENGSVAPDHDAVIRGASEIKTALMQLADVVSRKA